MDSKKPYSSERWQGDPIEFSHKEEHKLTPEEEKEHQEFLKQVRQAWNIDENGDPLKDD